MIRIGAFFSNKFFGKPDIGAWTSRILANIIIVIIRTLIALYHDPDNALYLSGTAHYFLSGSISAIWYREIMRIGLLPLSLEEEMALTGRTKYIINENSSPKQRIYGYIISYLPSRHWFIRQFFDLICYVLFFIILCTMPHLSSKALGMPNNLTLELQAGGSLYALLILVGLLSRNSSFTKAFSWNLLCFSGKISFSMYLLHPIAFTLVNTYATSIGRKGAKKETDDVEKVNCILDAIMLTFVVAIVFAWCCHKVIERPIMKFTNYMSKTRHEHRTNQNDSNLHTA